jgi:hypothetical protein
MFQRVPIYSSGVGVIADWREKTGSEAHGLVIIAFFPPGLVSELTPGRTLSFELDSPADHILRPIVEAKAMPLNRATAMTEFDLEPEARSAILPKSAVAIVELNPLPQGASPDSLNGRVVRANYLLPPRRVGSYIPFVNSFFRD